MFNACQSYILIFNGFRVKSHFASSMKLKIPLCHITNHRSIFAKASHQMIPLNNFPLKNGSLENLNDTENFEDVDTDGKDFSFPKKKKQLC